MLHHGAGYTRLHYLAAFLADGKYLNVDTK